MASFFYFLNFRKRYALRLKKCRLEQNEGGLLYRLGWSLVNISTFAFRVLLRFSGLFLRSGESIFNKPVRNRNNIIFTKFSYYYSCIWFLLIRKRLSGKKYSSCW